MSINIQMIAAVKKSIHHEEASVAKNSEKLGLDYRVNALMKRIKSDMLISREEIETVYHKRASFWIRSGDLGVSVGFCKVSEGCKEGRRLKY
jgi:hypothetical protein